MQIEKVPVGSLVLDPTNARKHDQKNLEAIKGSLAKFGQQKPIVVTADNVVIAGNGTLEAAKALGWEKIDIHRTVLKGAEAMAYALADNRTAELADWDDDILKEQIGALSMDGWDVGDFGFDLDDFDLNAGGTDGNTDPDEVPDVEENIHSVERGQIWQLGEHRLMCGDSTDKGDVEKLMAGEKADMVFTDPPYGIGIDGQKESKAKNPKHNRKAHDFKGWDDSRPPASIFEMILALGVPAGIFGGNYFADLLPPSRGWIFWGKGQDGALTSSDGELCWSNLEKPLRSLVVNRGALQGSVHPTQKPSEVVEFCLDYLGKGKSVLDLFLGSGSTLIACEKTGRRCYGMEIDPHYCSVIIERWQNFTGKEAKRLG